MSNLDVKPLFVFEMANNHMGSVEHGLRIIRELHETTFSFRPQFRLAVKLQYRHLDTFLHPAWRDTDLKYVKRFRETRLSTDDFRILKAEMDKLDFLSICTPFDERSVDLIEQQGFAAIKIASCSFTDWPLLERVACCDKPIIASVAGMLLEDIDKVVSFFQHRRKSLSLMHCVAEYPTADEHLQLNQIDLLRSRYPGVRIGYSTHESPEQVDSIQIAIGKGASIFEKHVGIPTELVTLNAYSATPQQIRQWLESAQSAFRICGVEGRRPTFSDDELSSMQALRRGVFAARAIMKGERIQTLEPDVFLAIPTQPGQITANDLSKYITFSADAEITAGEPILFSQVRRFDHREKVQAIVQRINSMIQQCGVIVPGQAELEISHHFGLERFEETGATIINLVNREYCKKLIVLLPGQSHPEHCHKLKEETFLVLHGDVSIDLNSARRECGPGDLLVVERGARHSFRSIGGAIMEEISSTHYKNDSYYTDPTIPNGVDRKTEISYWLEAKEQFTARKSVAIG
jgi:sialic acid synthase SpsE/quercetin dioxygenase-like cupin family protein